MVDHIFQNRTISWLNNVSVGLCWAPIATGILLPSIINRHQQSNLVGFIRYLLIALVTMCNKYWIQIRIVPSVHHINLKLVHILSI